MSADRAALQALAVRTKAPVRYFELVKFKSADHNVTCFLAVGKHALYLVRRSLGGLYPNDQSGVIFFAFIRSMDEDAEDSTQLKLLLSESGARAWMGDMLTVWSKNRHALAQQIQVAWNTDYIFRFGQVRHLHLTSPPPSSETSQGFMASLVQFFQGEKDSSAQPFKGCKEVLHSAYRFFIPESYMSQDHAGHFLHQNRLLELEIAVHQPVSLADLEASHHNHIRWAGLEYKRSISLSLKDVMITKSSSYQKRLNLSKDICAWTGWEITLISEDRVMAIILLRRQFVPPLADTAQDFSIRVECQRWAVDEGKVEEQNLLEEARLIADSTMPSGPSNVLQQIYPDFLQAKLDTLVLPESAWAWTEKTLKMRPSCKKQACIFVNSILKVLHEEHQLPSSELLEELVAMADGEEVPLVISPLEAAQQAKQLIQLKEEDSVEAMNAWMARVARYFTYCLNGVFFASFHLDHVCNAVLTQKPNQVKLHEAMLFLLHARPKDLTQKWELKELKQLLLDPELFEKYDFNNHALQAFLEFGWLARQLKAPKQEEKMSLEFTQFLCALLVLPEASIDLKAAICRTITWASSGQLHMALLVPTLSSVLKQRNIFLKTCATVTLVNMTKCHEPVKDVLTRMDAQATLVEHLGIPDDDLIYYTLMLTTSLSRTTAQRLALQKCGAVEELVHLLQMTYSESKDHLLAELASSVGQLCNEEDIRSSMAEAKVFRRLMSLYTDYPCSSRLRAKLMFAIRQFCTAGSSTSESLRDDVAPILPQVIEELSELVQSSQPFDTLDDDQTDWLVSSVLLLYTLAIDRTLLEEMRDPELQFKETLLKLRFSPLKELDVTRERIIELWELLRGDAEAR